jgi:glycosyltransferase involved in cell wall biosynthesis
LRESNIRAAILIVPSRVEGFPNVVLEAALAGWPILVSLEVADCIKGSPVAGFCDTAYFESPLDFNYLEKIVQSHSNRKSLESIFSIRQTHSLDNFKKIIREFMF